MVELGAGQQFKLSTNVNVEEIFADYNKDETKASYNKVVEAAKDGVIDENELVDLQGTFSTAELDELLKDATVEDAPKTEDGEKPEGTKKPEDNPEIKKLQGEIDIWQKELDKANQDITDLKAKESKAKQDYEDAVKAKDDKAKELEEKNQTLKDLSQTIDKATENLEDDMNAKIRKAKNKAIMNYNPEEHGDNFSAYLDKQLEDIGVDPSIRSLISSLSLKAESITSEIKQAASELNALWDKVDIASTAYTQASKAVTECQNIIDVNPGKIAANKAKIAELDPLSAVKDLVSEEELAIVKEHDLDLTETLPGSDEPRYIIAKGAVDGKYHIYDMGDTSSSNENGTTYYKSIGRIYGSSCGGEYGQYGVKGEDVCAWGNGWISKLDNAGTDVRDKDTSWYSGTEGTVYHLNKCGELEEECAKYSTASPLTLDTNGNGIEMKDEQVDFDIDGDGVMDKIYDAGDAVLVFDKDGDGKAGEDGSELFGNNTDLDGDGKADGYKDGFEALAALARKEGLINDGDDMELDENDLKYLADNYGLAIKTNGYNSEASSLEDAGITKINLSSAARTSETNFDGRHNDIMRQEGATFEMKDENGNTVTRDYADVWNVKLDENGNPIKESEDKNHQDINTAVNSALTLNLDRSQTQGIENDSQDAEKKVNNALKQLFDAVKKHDN